MPWDLTQVAILLLPFSSLLGGVGVLVSVLGICACKFRTISRRPLNWGFALLSLLMLVSTVFSFKPADAGLGLFNFLPFFLVFAALSELIQTPAQLRRLVWLLVLSSIPVVMIGLGQQFWGWAGHVPLMEAVLDWEINPTGNPPGRMASVFSYANVLANYLVITFILSLGLWIEQIRFKIQPANLTKQRLAIASVLTLAVLGNAIALILTNSRNAWAIAALAGLAYALYLGWRWLLVMVAGVAGAILGAAFGPSPVRDWLRTIVPAFFWVRLTDQLYPDRPVGTLRVTQWKFAWSLAEQRPLTGWGLRNFSPLYQAQTQVFIGHPHNLPLMLVSEIGAPATLLFLFLVGWVVHQGTYLLHQQDTGPKNLHLKQAVPLFLDLHGSNSGRAQDSLILFSTLTAFMGGAIFSLFDITFFDVRINLLGWLLLSAICGLVYHQENGRRRKEEG